MSAFFVVKNDHKILLTNPMVYKRQRVRNYLMTSFFYKPSTDYTEKIAVILLFGFSLITYTEETQMKQETKDYIEQVTSEVREKFNSPTPIKDITDLINHMGGIVESSSLEELNTKGTVKKQGGRFLIRYFDRFGSQKEANWIVAVTLGHILLHLRWGTNPKHWCKFPDADLIIHAPSVHQLHG